MLSVNLNKPFIGHHDFNGAFWGNITRNYLVFFNLESSEYLNRSDISIRSLFLFDYTPLLPIILTFFSILFGFSDFSLRLTVVIFSLIMIFFIYKIGELLYGKLVGVLAAVFAGITPMFLYFGKMPDHEPVVTALVTVTFFFYVKLTKSKNTDRFWFLTFLLLALLVSWPAFFLIVPIFIFSLLVIKDKFSNILAPIAMALFVFASYLLSIYLIGGKETLLQFLKQGSARMNSSSDLIGGFSNFNTLSFISTEAHYAVIYFTKILLILGSIWILSLLTKAILKKITRSDPDLYLLILLIYPLSFILVFRQLAFIHDYKLYHFLPFIALCAAVILNRVLSKLEKHAKIVICFVVIIFVFFERLDYLNTLLKSSFNTPGFELGTLIKKKTKHQEYTLVNSNQFRAFFEVFMNYYSQRRIEYADMSVEDFKNNQQYYSGFKYIILIDNRSVDPVFEQYMNDNFTSERYGAYRFFSVTDKLPQ